MATAAETSGLRPSPRFRVRNALASPREPGARDTPASRPTLENGAQALRVVASAAMSDRGRCRERNEDRLLDTAPLFAVADGVGGADAGHIAAQLAIDALARGDRVAVDPGVLLRAGFYTADADIRRAAAADSRHGMATTLTAALLAADKLTVCHAGDSRAYLLRAGRLHQLTRDHSLVGELLRRGVLDSDQAARHPMRAVITRCLGGGERLDPDLYTVEARPADIFLLCSDGLTDAVDELQVTTILRTSGDLRTAARQLVAAANQSGGRDNVTVVLFRLGATGKAGSSHSPLRPLRLVS